MITEFNLSDWIMKYPEELSVEHVKEFIRLLKEEFYSKYNGWMPDNNIELWEITEGIIDKLAGDELK